MSTLKRLMATGLMWVMLFSIGVLGMSVPSGAAEAAGPYIERVGAFNTNLTARVSSVTTNTTFRLVLAMKKDAVYSSVGLNTGYLGTFSPVSGLAGMQLIQPSDVSSTVLGAFGILEANKANYVYYGTSIQYKGNGEATLQIDIRTELGSTTETIVVPGVNKVDEPPVVTPPTIPTPEYAPVIRIQDGVTSPLLLSGAAAVLDVPLTNISSDYARELIVTMSEPGATPFKLDQSSTHATIDTLSSGTSKTARFNVMVSPTAQSKIYAIKLNLQYKDAAGQLHTDASLVYYVRVKAANVEPTIGITNYRFTGDALKAGVKDQMALVLQNVGTIDAADVRVKLTGFDAGNLRLSGDVDTKYIGVISGKQTAVTTFNILAPTGTKSGTHELTAEITYIDIDGKAYTTTSMVYVPIEGDELSTQDIKILNLRRPQSVYAGGTFSVSFVVKNEGRSEARLVEVAMEYPSEAVVPKTSPKQTFRTLQPGASETLTFTFQARKEVTTNFYDLYANVRYNSITGTEPLQVREYAGVSITGATTGSGTGGTSGRPKIIIRDYDFGGDAVLAGTEYDLRLDLYNTSSTEGIRNIKVTLKPEEGVFSPIDMASSFFIETLGRQESLSKIIRMRVKNDAAVKTYGLTVTFEYEDSKGNAYDDQKNPYKEEEVVSIPVIQPVRLETSEIGVPFEVFVNNPIPLSFEFYNLGKSTLYNMMVKVEGEGDFQIQGSNYYVGNFEAGRSDYFDTTLIPFAEGQSAGMVVFEYEDANGVPGRIEKPFSVMVMADPFSNPGEGFPGGENPGEGFPGEGGQEPGPASKLMILAILAGMAALMGGILIWKHRLEKKRKLAAEVVEEDE